MGESMNDQSDNLFYLAAGPLAAVLLGLALVPLRDATTAGNLTFAFLVLTIVAAELGGGWSALATAVASTLSLNFFLTKPYATLRITDKNDMIACAGLALCGLIVANFAARRRERNAALRTARCRLGLFHSALGLLEGRAAVDSRLPGLLDEACAALPIAAAVVRTARGDVLAASERGHGPEPRALLAPDAPAPPAPLPKEGARLALVAHGQQIGWLDVWGSGAPASAEARRALGDLARIAAVVLWSTSPAPGRP
jgi:two-component system sensor histidine kinase KdpD